MRVLYTISAVALLSAEVAAQDSAPKDDQGFITREWTWAEGTSLTTFTAYGPAEEVNTLDPQDSPLECEGCLLASSVQYGAEDEPAPIRVLTGLVQRLKALAGS